MIIEVLVAVLVLAGLVIYTEWSMKKSLQQSESEAQENRKKETVDADGLKEKEAEIEGLKNALSDEIEEVKYKENEIETLREQLAQLNNKENETVDGKR